MQLGLGGEAGLPPCRSWFGRALSCEFVCVYSGCNKESDKAAGGYCSSGWYLTPLYLAAGLLRYSARYFASYFVSLGCHLAASQCQ